MKKKRLLEGLDNVVLTLSFIYGIIKPLERGFVMVNYNLGLCTKSTTDKIELSKILGEKVSKKLESIDEFTTLFNNEYELKIYLYKKGLINSASLNKNLNIFYRNRGKNKRLPVMYSEHKKIMEKFEIISKKILTRESKFNMYTSESVKYNNLKSEFEIFTNLIGNINFLHDISRHYSIGNAKYNPQFINVSDINMFLSDVRSNGGHVFYPNYMYIVMYELFKEAIYKIEKKPDKNKVSLNYRGYRDLINFIYKYKLDNNLIKKNNTDKELKQMKLEQIEEPLIISHFYTDRLENEEELYEEGFAPNSEELISYKKYLESLPDENYSLEEKTKHRK